jgi:hypothetical protein
MTFIEENIIILFINSSILFYRGSKYTFEKSLILILRKFIIIRGLSLFYTTKTKNVTTILLFSKTDLIKFYSFI